MEIYARRALRISINLISLSRPFTVIVTGFTVIVGAVCATNSDVQPFSGDIVAILSASVSAATVAAVGNMFNDVIDLETDRINHPQRALPSGQLDPKNVLVSSILIALFACLLSITVNLAVFLLTATALVTLALYSIYLKNTVLLGNLVVGILSGLLFLVGAYSVETRSSMPIVWFALVAMVGVTSREILKTIADSEGDRQVGLTTVAVVFGRRRALAIYQISLALFILLCLVPYLIGLAGIIYLIIVIALVLPIVVISSIQLLVRSTVNDIRRVLTIQKLAFWGWLMAIVMDRLLKYYTL